MGFELNDLQKDNVDAISCVFKTWSKKKKEWMRREAYWAAEKSLPPFEAGDYVRYVVQSNFVVAYEVLKRSEEASDGAESPATSAAEPVKATEKNADEAAGTPGNM